MNNAHFHLILNHVPTLGAVVGVGLMLLSFVRKSDPLKHAALETMFIVAVVTLPVFTTGEGAYREIRERAEISQTAVQMHREIAIYGFTVTELAGFAAWVALWQMRRRGRASSGAVATALGLAVVGLVIMGGAATLGGEIRHPEIAAEVAATIPPAQFIATRLSTFLTTESAWAWPAAEVVHFLGLSLSLGVLFAVNLRLLGAMKMVPFADVHRLLPWGMLGFGANLITGMLFVVATPGQYVDGGPFIWKIVFLMIAAANFLYLTEFRKSWETDGFVASLSDKAMAIGSLGAWLAVLYAGRMLPFLGTAF